MTSVIPSLFEFVGHKMQGELEQDGEWFYARCSRPYCQMDWAITLKDITSQKSTWSVLLNGHVEAKFELVLSEQFKLTVARKRIAMEFIHSSFYCPRLSNFK